MNELATQTNLSRFNGAASEIAELHGKLVGYMKKSVALIYEIGQRLSEVKDTLDHGDFTPWVEQNCPFNIRTAQRYIKVYDQYKNDTVSLLKDKTITEAYLEAGVKKLAGPANDEEAEALPEVHTARDEAAEQARIDALLRTKPIAAALKRYRVLAGDGEIKYVHPGCATPLPVAHVYVAPQAKAEMAGAYQALQEELQAAFERYFFQVETAEDSGVLEKPEDLRLSTMRANIRKSKGRAEDASFEAVANHAGVAS